MEKYDVLVVGAGISGLSLAHYCARAGFKTVVIEKRERTGGAFCSHRFEGEAEDFWLEMGAHTCYNSYGNFIGILEDRGIMDRIIPRERVSFKMLVDHEVKSIVSQLSFPELLLSAPRVLTLKKEGRSVESYYSKIVGLGNFDKVFSPAFNAVVSQDARDFPADMLFKKRGRRKDVIKKFTLTGGVQTVTDAISNGSDFDMVRGQEVTGLDFRDGLFEAALSDGRSFQSPFLAVAAPATVAARLLRPLFPDVAGLLSRIEVFSVESVGVAVRRDSLSLGSVAGIIPRNDAFFSAVSRDSVSHDLYRGFAFHFKPGLTDRDAKMEKIAGVLGIDRGRLDQVAFRENLVPALRVGHGGLVRQVDDLLANKCLFLTGNYFIGLAIEDCVSRSLGEFRRLKRLAGKT
ncbi:MAG: FAD-dependent oxidoreductase [Candidatus Sulfobium sp.]|jgi:oxygen-dependent protoporphyrinogen oxidase